MPPMLRRFEMTAALTIGTSASVVPIIYDSSGNRITSGPQAQPFTVLDSQKCFSKMQTTSGDAGALGVAMFTTDHGYLNAGRWEILSMQTPGDFWGELTADMSYGDDRPTVKMKSMLGGYNVFGTNHGETIVVANPPGGGNQEECWFAGRAGDRVFCRWDASSGEYAIVAVEPNDFGWQELDVVTRTSLAIDFANQTFSHHYFTQKIGVPWWVTIGDEVEH